MRFSTVSRWIDVHARQQATPPTDPIPAIWNWPALLLFLLAFPALAQQAAPPTGDTQPQAGNTHAAQPAERPGVVRQLPPDTVRPNYVLGPNDQILVHAPNVEEIDQKPFRMDADGNISLPLVGRIHAGGMTLQELEADLIRRLREYIRDPQVFVDVVQFRSAPVYFVGLFARPGIYPLQGSRTLTEMLTNVGGILPNASRHITITRHEEYGPIPLPNAVVDPERKLSTVDISLGTLRENINPAENILLQPYDVVSVGRAELLYMNGELGKIGGIEMEERDSISVLQAISQSGGFTRDAKEDQIRILRPVLGTSRRYVIYINAKQLLEGKSMDSPLLPGDIVYVPRSYIHAFYQTLGAIAIPMIPYVIFLATD